MLHRPTKVPLFLSRILALIFAGFGFNHLEIVLAQTPDSLPTTQPNPI